MPVNEREYMRRPVPAATATEANRDEGKRTGSGLFAFEAGHDYLPARLRIIASDAEANDYLAECKDDGYETMAVWEL